MSTEQVAHTAGPWRVETRPDVMLVKVYGARRDDGSDYAPICTFGDRSHLPDARLIAAAPDLLEALKTAREQLIQAHCWIRVIEHERELHTQAEIDDAVQKLISARNVSEAAISKAEGGK